MAKANQDKAGKNGGDAKPKSGVSIVAVLLSVIGALALVAAVGAVSVGLSASEAVLPIYVLAGLLALYLITTALGLWMHHRAVAGILTASSQMGAEVEIKLDEKITELKSMVEKYLGEEITDLRTKNHDLSAQLESISIEKSDSIIAENARLSKQNDNILDFLKNIVGEKELELELNKNLE